MTFNLQNYKQIKLLGQGQNPVYEYMNETSTHNKVIAVKEIFCQNLQNVKKAINEAMIQFRCNHKYLLKCLGYEQTDYPNGGSLCQIVMEKMDMSLSQFIQQKAQANSPFTLIEYQGMIGNLISALAYLDQNLICHRDIKSDNIFIKFKQKGYDTILGDVGGSALKSTQEKILKQNFVYTNNYKSPEISDAIKSGSTEEIFKQCEIINWTLSDVYSMGIVFLEIGVSKTVKTSGKSQSEFIAESMSIIQEKYGNQICQLIGKMLINNPNQRYSPKDLCTYVEQQFKKGEINIELTKDGLGEVKEIGHARDDFEEKLFLKIQSELHCLQHPQEIITQICLTCLKNENSFQKFVCTQCLGNHKGHQLESMSKFLGYIQSNHNLEKQYEYLNVCTQIQQNTLQKQQFIQCWNDYFKNLLNAIQQEQQNQLKNQLKHFEDRQQKLEQAEKVLENDQIKTQNPLKQKYNNPNVNIKAFKDNEIRDLEKLLIERYQEKTNLKPQTVYKQDNKYGNSLIEQLKGKSVEKIVSVLRNDVQLQHQFYKLESYVVNKEPMEEKKTVEMKSKVVDKFNKFKSNYPTDKPVKEKKLIRKN